MGHVVLLGDSIFDNARYVPDGLPLIEQLRRGLGSSWKASLLAVDGGVTEDVVTQLKGLPASATHLVVSVGGNDALSESYLLRECCVTVGEALEIIHASRERFRENYRAMLAAVLAIRKPTAVCTVYDCIPRLDSAEATALAVFNEVILHEAVRDRLPILDLRLICDSPDDFSPVSPIEPSVAGGTKITRAIADVVARHCFQDRRSTIYI
jgi:hypothetical protein